MAASSDGDVASSISGGHQDNVVIARDISGPITITAGGARTPRYLQDPDNWPLARAWEALAAGAHRTRLGDDGSAVPPYVARDQDTLLRERIMQAAEHGGLVLVVGDSTAGKTRAACEAVRAVLPDHRILAPACGEDVPWAVDVAARTGVACVVWLDDLENFVGPQELEPALLAELVRLRIPVVATMRTQQYDTFNPQAHDQDSPHDPASSKRALAVGARVLNLTEPVELQRLWTGGELARAADCDDSRVIDALTHHGPYGIAEYLAAGPALLHQWRRANRAGGHPRGAALVAAAVDLTRTGLRPPYHLDVLAALHQSYLDQAGGPLLRPESLDEALSWAGDVRYGVTSLLLPTADPGAWTVFDYLVDQTFTAIPEDVWEAALTHAADASDRFTVGVHAYSVAPHIAEAAWLPLAHSANPAVAYNLGNLLTNLGRVAEAETYYRQALDAGDTHAANNLGNLLTNLGRVAEAETYYRQALDAGDTHAANNLGNLL
ncbi:tetratricopeptide repeat protein, partial [Streptomyces sp. NPDC006733]|uniref:tetratricopeptide repeat protein n=1 Tax=Streptomyces sp. NPDC006733 TaxID=3155460 RepID=UPI0033DE45B4